MHTKPVGFGPFIGDFEQEICTFRPHIKYLIDTHKIQNPYVSTHGNRRFLYDFIDDDKFIPVFENITRNELDQNGYIHNDITKPEFNQLIRLFRTHISKREKLQINDIEIINIPYIKSINSISFQEKKFEPININDIDIPYNNMVLLIPGKDVDASVYNNLTNVFDNIIVIGDMKSGLYDDNVILKDQLYFHDNYNTICNYISKSQMVITTVPHWAFLCNLQQTPLVYFGDMASMYKSEGVFGFNNKVLSVTGDIKSSMCKYHYNNVG